MSRVLVIGGSGFIGLNTVDELLAAGHEVRVTRRKSTPTIFLRKRPVELVDASLEDPGKLAEAMRGSDVVFLVAAHYPRYSFDLDAAVAYGRNGVRNACEAALRAEVKRFVFTSSIGSLATVWPERLANEDDVPAEMPRDSVYRAVKWALEREIEAATAAGLPTVTLLPGGCVGPWDVRVGTGAMLVGVARGEMPWWCEGWVNVVDVGDVARAHVAAIEAPVASRYCIAGHNIRVGNLLTLMAVRFRGKVPELRLSVEEARMRADEDERAAAPKKARVPVPREFVDLVAYGQPISSERAERDLGITFTELDTALDRAHAWFVRFRYIPEAGATIGVTHEQP